MDRDTLEYYVKYQYFLSWFEENSDIKVCIWNRDLPVDAGIDEMIPQLTEAIHNVDEWNAYIIDEPFHTMDYMDYDFKHNTQYSINPYERNRPVRSFDEDGNAVMEISEYDSDKDRLLRLIYFLGGKTPVNMTIEDLDEADNGKFDSLNTGLSKERDYKLKYYFGLARPANIYLITPRVFENLNVQKHFLSFEIVNQKIEDEQDKKLQEFAGAEIIYHESEFWTRYDYPSNCRFIVVDIPEKDNARYNDAWFLLWMSVFTLMLNSFKNDEFGAMKLYRMNVDVSTDELSQFLNKFYTELLVANEANDKDIERETEKLKAEMEDTSSSELPETPQVFVNFPHFDSRDFMAASSSFGLCKDTPRLDESVWDEISDKSDIAEAQLFKAAERGKREAVEFMRRIFTTELPMVSRRKLSRYDKEDLEEATRNEEYELVCMQADKTSTRAEFEKIRKEGEKGVKDFMPKRTFHKNFILSAAAGAVVYFAGFIPLLINSANYSGWSLLIGILMAVVPTALIVLSAFLTMKAQRKKFEKEIRGYNSAITRGIAGVQKGPETQGKYLSTLLSYMLKYQMLKKCSIDTILLDNLNTLYRASAQFDEALAQCRSIAGLCHFNLSRLQDVAGYDRNLLYRGNRIYLHENTRDYKIAFNDKAEYLNTPFRFVSGLSLVKEKIYECDIYNNETGAEED